MTVQESPKDNIETTVNMNAFDRENNSLRSIAISLKRIADVMEGDKDTGSFLQRLFFTLEDASFNHSQRTI